MAVLVDLAQVSARTADRVLFDDLSLTVVPGDRIGVVGINGTGKSTLLRLLAGVDEPSTGQARRGRGTRVGFLDQDPRLTVGTLGAAVGGGWEAEAALERLGLGPARDTLVAELSGGQVKRGALAAVLAHPSDLLVLDEPTNHLDIGAVAWLERRLLDFRGGLVLVSHDRHLLDRVTTRMLELDRGHSHVHEGGYASYLEARAGREESAASAEATRRNLARRELAWLRRGPPARTSKPQARIDAAVRLIEARPEAQARSTELEMALGTPRLGDKVIECLEVGFSFDADGPAVLSSVDLALSPRDRLGIVGANGSGKSTLLDLLAGRRRPDTGRIEVGSTVVTGYYDQQGAELDPGARVQELVAGPTRSPGNLQDVALMKRFWFTGELPYARVGTLSGGERRRLQLLLVLAGRPNVLFLDEPTNDLDLDTLRIVEEFLEDWPGALVVVSHDRTFLERTTSRLLAIEGGTVAPVRGGVGAWIARVEGDSRVAAAPSTTAVATRTRAAPARPARTANLGGRLRDLERVMVRLRKQAEELGEELTRTVDRSELARVGTELAGAHARLEEAEEQWLMLAEEAESAR